MERTRLGLTEERGEKEDLCCVRLYYYLLESTRIGRYSIQRTTAAKVQKLKSTDAYGEEKERQGFTYLMLGI